MVPVDKITVAESLIAQNPSSTYCVPPVHVAVRFLQRTLGLLFPQLRSEDLASQGVHASTGRTPPARSGSPESEPDTVLTKQSEKEGAASPSSDAHRNASPELLAQCTAQLEEIERDLIHVLLPLGEQLPSNAAEISAQFILALPELRDLMLTDATAILSGDPAAKSLDEVIVSYPGFFATATHRIAHTFTQPEVPLLPRILSEYAHQRTGIDIHPRASIGPSFCIDHGTGIVIGETSVLGAHVKLYQGVTLGALSVDKNLAKSKRHPTIEDHVVVYSNATILGGETVVGHHSTIGGNVWLTNSVPPHSTVYHRGDVILKQGPGSSKDSAILTPLKTEE